MPSENTRRITKNTAMLYIRMLLIMAVTLYTSRVVLNVLGVEDFGIYNVVGGIVVMFSFLNGAMALSTQRFLAFELGRSDFRQLQKVFSLSVVIHVGIAFFIFVLAETIGLWFLNIRMNIPVERMSAARWVYQFSVFSFMVSVIQVPYNAAIIARERMHVYAYISIIEVLLKLLVVYMLTWLSFDKLKLYGTLIFGITVIVALLYQGYGRWKFGECRIRFIWDRRLFKELTNFAGWGILGSLVGVAKNQGLNVILNIFFGTVINAAYGIANQVNAAVGSFNQNFMTAINPQMIKAYANGNHTYLINLLFRGCKVSFYLLFLISLPILLQTRYILGLWLKVVPDYTTYFIHFILINSLLEAFTYPIGTCVQATGKIKWYQIFVSGTNLMLLPVSYMLFRNGFPPLSSFILLVIITFVALQIRLVFLYQLVGVSIKNFCIQVLGVAMLVAFIGSLIPGILKQYLGVGFDSFCLLTAICWIWALIVIWVIGFNKEEKSFFMALWKEKFKIKK